MSGYGLRGSVQFVARRRRCSGAPRNGEQKLGLIAAHKQRSERLIAARFPKTYGMGRDLLADYLALQSAERAEQFVLLGFADVKFVQGFHEVFDQRVEVGIR